MLFEPFKMRGLTLQNRIVLSPMCQYAAEDGLAGDWHIMHLGQYACGNLGLIITEATGVEPRGRISPHCLGLYSDASRQALARVVAFCKSVGDAKFGVQLSHAGRKSSVPPSFRRRAPLAPDEGGWTPIAPSFIEDGVHPPPQVMDAEMIAQVKADWRDATRRAGEIGVDLVELHFAHGYLVNQFLSPLTNQRDDSYGGSRENRMRLALEIFDACRAVFPQDRPMGVRISAVDWVEGGWTIEDSIELSLQLRLRGCDYVCASSGGVSLAQKIVSGPGYQVPFARAVRQQAGVATIAVGQIWHPDQAESVLQEGSADLIAIGRRLLVNPRWAWMAAQHFRRDLDYPARYRAVQPRFGEKPPDDRQGGVFMFRSDESTDGKRWG